jgi:hypothetical protein
MAFTKHTHSVLERQPCLAISDLRRLVDADSGHLEWRTATELVGTAEFRWRPPGRHRFVLDHALRSLDSNNTFEGQAEFQNAFPPSRVGDSRAFIVCNECGNSRFRIYFFEGSWACRICHGLVYASQRKCAGTRNTERLEHLQMEIGRGRPKGMHGSKYLRLRQEHANLAAEVKLSGRRFASYELSEPVFLSKCMPEAPDHR